MAETEVPKYQLEDILNKAKAPPQILDLQGVKISTEEEYRKIMEKIPEYKVKPEKVAESTDQISALASKLKLLFSTKLQIKQELKSVAQLETNPQANSEATPETKVDSTEPEVNIPKPELIPETNAATRQWFEKKQEPIFEEETSKRKMVTPGMENLILNICVPLHIRKSLYKL
ncbi:uncharacterized protein LOC111718358 isoform X1 [Eurytemora carolleeae]|uniref:uncharacterized protein LOC111718358 isoform X1 n=1 Tax=Eurytemora carolleeae TaxID=1294199 RepID=UPI000C76134E|nr:uncharacterized protein LOC111718358 isoform X1 [Eurytemora carolleeae]|eukprot:XP_023349693.1 uncharacterized protein LOC111718358 isoform X1 [Eurytemora affinis]